MLLSTDYQADVGLPPIFITFDHILGRDFFYPNNHTHERLGQHSHTTSFRHFCTNHFWDYKLHVTVHFNKTWWQICVNINSNFKEFIRLCKIAYRQHFFSVFLVDDNLLPLLIFCFIDWLRRSSYNSDCSNTTNSDRFEFEYLIAYIIAFDYL